MQIDDTQAQPLLLRAEEVAGILGVGRTKVFAMIWAGELPVVRLGRSVRVNRARLHDWINERTVGGVDHAA